MTPRLDPASFAQAVLLDSADIPADMTLAQWRRERWAASRMSRRRRRRVKRFITRRALFSH
jgi:hypothetical protein